MARSSGNRCRWLLRASEVVLLASVLLVYPARAKAEAAADDIAIDFNGPQIAPTSAIDQLGAQHDGAVLMLAVSVNGMDQGIALFRLVGDELWSTRQVLAELGLRTDAVQGAPNELLSVSEALGAQVSYNAAQQSVVVLVEPSRLAVGTSRLNSYDQDQPVAQSATGFLLNFDLNANFSDYQAFIDGFTEARLFSGNAMLESTMLLHLGSGATDRPVSALRLDTTAAFSLPESRLTLRAGDIIARSTGWSRPIRIGGLRFGTDFALQPYLVTAPIPEFFGQATLPSTVDLYINGLKRFSGSVPPGPFELGSGANRINGAGQAQIVITDALGQVSTLDLPIYDTPQLLRAGLTDWSIEFGAIRENYGLRSFDYSADLVASGSYRRGMSDVLTLEAHSETGAGLVNGGAGVSWLLPLGGVVAVSAAGSSFTGQTGYHTELSYSWTNSRFNLSAVTQRASRSYKDLAALREARVAELRDVLTIGYSSSTLGNFSASVLRQQYTSERMSSFASVNWSRSLGDRFALNVSAHQDLQNRRERGVFLSLAVTPRSGDHLFAGLQASDRRTSASLGYRRSLPHDGGIGWAADTSYDGDRFQGAAQIDYLGRHGQATVGARVIGGSASGYVGFSGALVAMGDRLFSTRKVVDGFAVVSTDGVADVPVLMHNRAIGRTNQDGLLLVSGLNAYQNNQVSIDVTDLSATLWVASLEQQVVPSARAGALVTFEISPIRSVLVTLVDQAGAEVPVGVAGHIDGDDPQSLIVGFGGQLFIERADAGASIILQLPSGPCGFHLPDELPSENAGRLGKITCEAI